MSNNEDIDRRKDWNVEASEGGWGYMVCLGLSLIFIVVVAPITLLGVIFNDLFDNIDDGTSSITLICGIHNAVVSLIGFFTSNIIQPLSLRKIGLTGAFIFVMGSILTIFSQEKYYIIFTIGILEGIGFGMMFPVALTTFNYYFVKRRSAMMNLSSVIIGIGFMAYPLVIKKTMESYGLRGTLILLSGLSFHAFLAMAVMVPPDLHLRHNNIKKKLVTDIACEDDTVVEDNHDIEMKSNPSYKSRPIFQKQESITLLGAPWQTSISYSNLTIMNEELDHSNLHKVSSLVSLGNWTGIALANEVMPTKVGPWKRLLSMFDMKLLKDLTYTNMCFGASFAFFSESTFGLLVPVLLSHYNFTPAEVAYCMTIVAFTDLVSRIVLTISSFKFTVSSRKIVYFGILITVILRNVFLKFYSFRDVTIIVGFIGFFRSWIMVPLPLIFAETISKDLFSKAYGLFMMICGIITLFLSMIIGILKNYTENHMFPFHFLTLCSLFILVTWTVELYTKSCWRK